jgi:hypothetical protein
MKLRTILLAALAAAIPLCAQQGKPIKPGQWVSMFDGKSIENSGWKANENPEAWTVEDGVLKGSGPVSHLFWMVDECEDCEFKAEVKIADGANSGMYFRTAFGPRFPKGYEAQVNATHRDPVKTGSLYSFHKNLESPHKPDEWFTQHIIVQGNHIVIKVNDKVITDFVDEKNTHTKGYIALQQHDPKSVVWYRNLMYKRLEPAKK